MSNIVMNVTKFVETALDIANKYKTLYVMGGFGAPLYGANKKRYINDYAYNQKKDRANMILTASDDTFAFDCVCLIKGILWGWNGELNSMYGGAKYKSNGVPDFGTDEILNYCNDVSTDFSNIEVGEIVHMPGHVGIYVGNNRVVECSPKWANDVQITTLGNNGVKGQCSRNWKDHGKLQFVDYSVETPTEQPKEEVPFLVRVKINNLNIRKGPGTDYDRQGWFTGIGTFTIVEVQQGKGSEKGWGRLKSGAGWISLDYTEKVQ